MSRDGNNAESEVKFPSMRSELQYAVKALADEDFQRRMWVGPQDSSLTITYTFDMALHALLDDSVVADNGEAAIGVILKNERELDVVANLISTAREVIREIGLKGSFLTL